MIYSRKSRRSELKGGTVSVDDSVLDKPYSHLIALVGYFWSGNIIGWSKALSDYVVLHRSTRPTSTIDYRIYDKTENKTKNDYFQEIW